MTTASARRFFAAMSRQSEKTFSAGIWCSLRSFSRLNSFGLGDGDDLALTRMRERVSGILLAAAARADDCDCDWLHIVLLGLRHVNTEDAIIENDCPCAQVERSGWRSGNEGASPRKRGPGVSSTRKHAEKDNTALRT